MVAFNFMECFADDVERGIKRGSIRAKKKCNVGDKIQLYTGQRTKQCRKLGDAVCTGIIPIRVTDDCPWSMDMDNKEGEIIFDDVRLFHQMDGFKNAKEFVDFFRKHYGLPFNGYYHQWIKETPDEK